MSIIDIRRHYRRTRDQPPPADSTNAKSVQGESARPDATNATPEPPAPGQLYYSVSRSEPYEYVFRIAGEQKGE